MKFRNFLKGVFFFLKIDYFGPGFSGTAPYDNQTGINKRYLDNLGPMWFGFSNNDEKSQTNSL